MYIFRFYILLKVIALALSSDDFLSLNYELSLCLSFFGCYLINQMSWLKSIRKQLGEVEELGAFRLHGVDATKTKLHPDLL